MELVEVLYVVATVQGQEPEESSASQPNLPLDQVRTLLEVQLAKSAPKKLVVEALVE